jgi:hypothetical protein
MEAPEQEEAQKVTPSNLRFAFIVRAIIVVAVCLLGWWGWESFFKTPEKTQTQIEAEQKAVREQQAFEQKVSEILNKVYREHKSGEYLLAVYKTSNYKDSSPYELNDIGLSDAFTRSERLPFKAADIELYDRSKQYFDTSSESQSKVKNFFLNHPNIQPGDFQERFQDRSKKKIRGFEINFVQSPKQLEADFYKTINSLIVTIGDISPEKNLNVYLSKEDKVKFSSWLSEKPSKKYLAFVFSTRVNDCYEIIVVDSDGFQVPKTRYYVSPEYFVPISDKTRILKSLESKNRDGDNAYVITDNDNGRLEFYFPAKEISDAQQNRKINERCIDIFVEQLFKDIDKILMSNKR